MNRVDTDYMIARVTTKVEANRMHWGSIVDILTERVTRIREQIEPLPGYAPVYKEEILMAELDERLNQIEEVKARYGRA